MKTALNIFALILLIFSFLMLYPGIKQPVLTIKGEMNLPILGKMELGSETRSILGTINYLYETKNTLVATLILIFSVCVPITKGLLLLSTFLPGSPRVKSVILALIKRIGKWSMADVFVVAIFLAFLASASMQVFKAKLEPGFYYFLTYCLVSVFATELICLGPAPQRPPAAGGQGA
jgi:paraquat-inducible protein A